VNSARPNSGPRPIWPMAFSPTAPRGEPIERPPSPAQWWPDRDVVQVMRKGEVREWRRACVGHRALTE
jgi:hypothetical protein